MMKALDTGDHRLLQEKMRMVATCENSICCVSRAFIYISRSKTRAGFRIGSSDASDYCYVPCYAP